MLPLAFTAAYVACDDCPSETDGYNSLLHLSGFAGRRPEGDSIKDLLYELLLFGMRQRCSSIPATVLGAALGQRASRPELRVSASGTCCVDGLSRHDLPGRSGKRDRFVYTLRIDDQ
jgi:hypothetical protein